MQHTRLPHALSHTGSYCDSHAQPDRIPNACAFPAPHTDAFPAPHRRAHAAPNCGPNNVADTAAHPALHCV